LAFTPPLYGLAGLVNPVRNVLVTTASESNNIRAELAERADFFVEAFWSSKLRLAATNGGGSAQRQGHDDKGTAVAAMMQLR
jgi:hypothetical protein